MKCDKNWMEMDNGKWKMENAAASGIVVEYQSKKCEMDMTRAWQYGGA